MTLRIHSTAIHLLDLRTRMPFKYGIATMTECPHAFVRVQVEHAGRTTWGLAADHLPPRWFTKVPDQPLDAEIDEMLLVIDQAARLATGIVAATPFDAWQELRQRQESWGRDRGLPPLLTQFGTSLIERGLIEAVCRQAGRPFAELLRANALGMRLEAIHPALADRQPADFLPPRPRATIIARHTVGMADPITPADIAPADRLDDGLPQALADCIGAYGLRHFKVKLAGQLDRDRERLQRVGAVIRQYGPADFALSLDGNEQFHSAAEFRQYWEALAPGLDDLLTHLLFVEQPLHRDAALDPRAGDLQDWPGRPALIIDESDGELDSLTRALALGYAGASHKNCKGVFKSIANACLLEELRRQGRPVILSGEDLANTGPVALLQDLAVCANLGIASVERNGHHFFAGLSQFPQDMQAAILRAHGDLYHASRDGWPTLTIHDGRLATGSVVAAPFGVEPVLDVERLPTRKSGGAT